MDDRCGQEGGRAGMVQGCTLWCYLRLVDWTSRLVRPEKANLHPAVAPIFVRLGMESSAWEATIARLVRETKRTGSHFGTAARLAEAARAHDRRWHRNQFRRAPHPPAPRPLPPDRAALHISPPQCPPSHGEVCQPWRSREIDWTMGLAANRARQRPQFVDVLGARVRIVLRRFRGDWRSVSARFPNPADYVPG